MSMSRKLHQSITYWAVAGVDKYSAETFSAPVLIAGRWEDRQDQVMLPTGELSVSKAIVFVDREIELDGYLAEGDYTAQNDPTLAGAKVVRAFVSIPSMRSNETERRAIL